MAATEAEDPSTCCTVETPSRLILFYPDTTPGGLAAHLPAQPICKPVGHHVTMGRSSSSDIRLNDERMSRLYASLWHDGKDPFVFRVSNLSERKLLLVDGAMLRYKEEAEVKDGTQLTLDFLQLKAKVCAGDYVAFFYQVAFIKNAVLSPPPPTPLAVSQIQPPDGKCLMPGSRNKNSRGRDLSSVYSCGSVLPQAAPSPDKETATGDVVSRLLTCLQTANLDSGIGLYSNSNTGGGGGHGRSLNSAMGRSFSCFDFSSGKAGPFLSQSRDRSLCSEEDVGVEYELPENLVPGGSYSSAENAHRGAAGIPAAAANGCSCSGASSNSPNKSGDNKLATNIPPSLVHNNIIGNKLSLNIPPIPETDSAFTAQQLTASTVSATPQFQQQYPFRLSCVSPPPQIRNPPSQTAPVFPPSSYPSRDNSNQPTATTPATKKPDTSSCWFNMDQVTLPKPQLNHQQKLIEDIKGPTDLPQIAQRIQDSVISAAATGMKAKPNNQHGCPSCRNCSGGAAGGDVGGGLEAILKSKPETTQPLMTLDDMVVVGGAGGSGRTPVENCEWDTDDPNINCYMD